MTYQETFDYLMQVRRAEYRIRGLETRCLELRACLLPAAIRYDLDKVQTSPEDSTGRIVAEMARLQDRISREEEKKARLITEIGAVVEKLDNVQEQIVLIQFFIGRKTMGEISMQISYSLRRTYDFRASGVRHLSALI